LLPCLSLPLSSSFAELAITMLSSKIWISFMMKMSWRFAR
jgi:hypothetical protein